MTRLIGGLLVVSLLYSPAKFQVKYIAYNLLKDLNKIEYSIRKEAENDTNDATKAADRYNREGSIDYAYMEFDDSTDKITSLINEKNMLYSKIESKLDLNSHLKLTLSNEQISSFADFMDCYNKESADINENLKKINERKKTDTVLMANLHNDANYDLILSEIDSVSEYEAAVIDSILRIIESGNETLRIL